MDFARIVADNHPGHDIYDFYQCHEPDDNGNNVLDVEATNSMKKIGKEELKLEQETYFKSFLVTTRTKGDQDSVELLALVISRFSGIERTEIADRELSPKLDYIIAYVDELDPLTPEDAQKRADAIRLVKGVRHIEAFIDKVPPPPDAVLKVLKEI